MSAPRFETPKDLDEMALRFQRTRCHRKGVQFRHFIENPEGFESPANEYLAKWVMRGPVFILDNPISLN